MLLIEPPTGHREERELGMINNIISSGFTIYDLVLQDLNKGKMIKSRTGARSMTAEKVLRAAVAMRLCHL